MKVYKSRISISIIFFLAVVSFAPIFLIPKEAFIPYITTAALAFLFCVACFFGIKYVIDGETLKVYYFPGMHSDIDIKKIRKMEPSRNILSSPAASLKRLAIHYNKYDMVLISPRNQEEFIEEINKIRTNH